MGDTGTAPQGRRHPQKLQHKVQVEEHVSQPLLGTSHELLAKFSVDIEKVMLMMEVLGCIELGVYCTRWMERGAGAGTGPAQGAGAETYGAGGFEGRCLCFGSFCDPQLPLCGHGDLIWSW